MWRPIEEAPRNTSILVAVDPNDPDTYSMACYYPIISEKYFYDFNANENLLKEILEKIKLSKQMPYFSEEDIAEIELCIGGK